METARSSIARNVFALLLAFVIGVLVANPSGFFWRMRYWVPVGDRAGALKHLVEAEPGGAASELASAVESGDIDLRLIAAWQLAARGDKRGVETLVALADAQHPGARERLADCLVDPDSLNQYESAAEWYAATHHVIHFQPTARWSGTSVN